MPPPLNLETIFDYAKQKKEQFQDLIQVIAKIHPEVLLESPQSGIELKTKEPSP